MLEVIFEALDALVGGAPELLLGEPGEPPFHQVDPRGVSGREMEVESAVPDQPAPDTGDLVGVVVVENEMEVEILRRLALDGLEEPEELLATVSSMHTADDSP